MDYATSTPRSMRPDSIINAAFGCYGVPRRKCGLGGIAVNGLTPSDCKGARSSYRMPKEPWNPRGDEPGPRVFGLPARVPCESRKDLLHRAAHPRRASKQHKALAKAETWCPCSPDIWARLPEQRPSILLSNLDPEKPLIVNLGSGAQRMHRDVLTLDLFDDLEVDIICDLRSLPFAVGQVAAFVSTPVIEHIEDVPAHFPRIISCLANWVRLEEAHQTNAAFRDVTCDRIEAQVQTGRPALLFFDDSFDPGRTATVNGHATRVVVAEYKFMAVPLTAGESHIMLEYRPRPFQIGEICAGIGVTALILAFVAEILRRLRKAPEESRP